LLARLGDGRYTLGFRAHHLALTKPVAPALEIAGMVSVSEITGSESFIHLAMHGHNFVALTQGIHRLEIGEALTGYVDPAHLFAFDPSGRCVMAPASVQGGAVA
jgi:glycerol transport system ATP-binding protein